MGNKRVQAVTHAG